MNPQYETLAKCLLPEHMLAPSSGSSYSSRSYDADEEEEEDGMRHFDPALEDYMDDNGMSRYMDNNDDEGWE